MTGRNSLIKRDSARNAIKRCLVASKKSANLDEEQIDSYLTVLNDHWSGFLVAQEGVELSCGDDAIQEQESEREQGEEWFREALANFKRARAKIKSDREETNSEPPPAPTRTNFKLPPLALPKFSGEAKDWRPFQDAFVSAVHNAETISNAQKLQYLRASLADSPRALQIVSGFPITNENYSVAWDLLQNRYNVQRVIIDSHFRAIFSLKKVNQESAVALRSLLDGTQEHFQSLKALGRPVTNWDDWLVHLTVNKLDQETHRQWELSLTDDKVPTFNMLVNFLEKRCRSLDAIDSHHNTRPVVQKGKSKPIYSALTASSPATSSSANTGNPIKCYFCLEKHKIFVCPKFLALNVNGRRAVIKEKKLCSNCLSSGHVDERCRSSNTCHKCHVRHHTFLHQNEPSTNSASSSPHQSQVLFSQTEHDVLLGTARVDIIDYAGRYQPARLLFDSGSHLTFISEDCLQRLKLRRSPKTTIIQGIGATSAGCSRGEVQLKLSSIDRCFNTIINAQILPKLTNVLPPIPLSGNVWNHLKSLDLADAYFNIPSVIDIILGADELGQFLCTGLIKGPHGTPIAQKSMLGWILFGKIANNKATTTASNATIALTAANAATATSAITAPSATSAPSATTATAAENNATALSATAINALKAANAATASSATANTASSATTASTAANAATASPAITALTATNSATASSAITALAATTNANTQNIPSATIYPNKLHHTKRESAIFASSMPMNFQSTCVLFCDAELTKAVSKFWTIEALPDSKHFSIEEKLCEKNFEETHYRQTDGRYVVKLPFKTDCPLGESRHAAIRALRRMEANFLRDEALSRQYKSFIKEFIDLGHMEKATQPPLPGKHYYMPHRAVLKDTSTTTKLRVVFNASCRTTSGFSFNDTQMIGPQLQPDLYLALIRMRTYRFALSADITKMYRQIRVNKEHIDFQRIVWRNTPNEEIEDYRILTVTYGVASSSHLAVKSIQQVALDEGKNYPEAKEVIMNHFYMDDLLTGSYEEKDLLRLQTEVASILSKGGFNLRKWSSNSPLIIDSIPEDEREVLHPLDLSEADGVRTLGLQWIPSTDDLSFSIKIPEVRTSKLTKRMLLSEAAKLFDPLGLLSPTTIIPKMMFQRLWKPKVDWDEPVPDDVHFQWLNYTEHISELAAIRIPRWFGCGVPQTVTDLHGFADASQNAYAAAVYSRTILPNGEIVVQLLTAKTRVAPLKTTTVSLPRLELCAAALLAQLIKTIQPTLQPYIRQVFGWTDSSITLAWIRQFPGKWTTFVANRVSQIQETISPQNWYHVPSAHNPADCATRGILPENLSEHSLWWNGPCWMKLPSSSWPPQKIFSTNQDQRSESINIATCNNVQPLWDLLDRYSSIRKLQRITAYIMRFLYNVKQAVKIRRIEEARPFRNHQHLHLYELEEALQFWVQHTQNFYFNDDINRLTLNKQVSRNSKLLKLHPFLDEKGLLRVGGRLSNATLKPDKKYPILLPKSSNLTALICADIHHTTLHGGPQLMQAILQNRFWVIGARGVLRKISLSCVKCRKQTHNLRQQLMGDLPRPRVSACRPFLNSGVDFAGPVHLRLSKGRGTKSIKGYVAVFICMATGAMHLELASDLSATTFISVFRRFVSRRGQCKDLYSDNGTNFTGAERELNIMLSEACKDKALADYLSGDGTNWHFNPPAAPHMGGYWETAVKRVKFHLRRTLGENLLTYEEFATLLIEIEACVNSRPLCPLSSDTNDLAALTPGHFLIGEPLKAIPEPHTENFSGNLVSRWHHISNLRQHFWRRWSAEYLVQLQQRAKWTRSCPNLQVGDLVSVRDANIPPTKWKLGRILTVHPGDDGRVRVVTIKTNNGTLTRPTVKISPLLPVEDEY